MDERIQVVEAEASHMDHIAANMREADREEILASSGSTPADALSEGLKRSNPCWAVLYDGVPTLMFGVTPISMLLGQGSPWLLGTDDIKLFRRDFIRECRGYVARMQAQYPVLINAVDARNTVSIKWLKWLGFAIMEPQPMGVNGELFHPFEMRSR